MKIFRAINLIVPTLLGLAAAFGVLAVGRPFPDRSTHITWIGIAVVSSILTSALAGLLLRRALPFARLFDVTSEFDTELTSRFKTSLRAGNARTLLKTGQVEMDAEEQVEHVLRLLDRITRHNRSTRGHSERVRAYSTLIGEELAFTEPALKRLSWAAVLHDVGKLDVPASILSSPTKPSKAQWAVLKRHPAYAHPYLQPLESWLGDAPYHAAAFHHERWDGMGYPRGIEGSDIPLIGRIVAVADAFDVMTHSRSYKKAYSIEHARDELEKNAGTQFDPTVVTAFLRIGEPRLKSIRGWAAGLSAIGAISQSGFATATGQVAVVAVTTAAAVVSVDPPPPETIAPPVVAFEDPAEEIEPETTTTTAPTTTTTTTTTSTTTTEAPRQIMSIGYSIATIDQDGLSATVVADRLEVSVDGEPNQTIVLDSADRSVTIEIDITDATAGLHIVTLDLYDGERLVSTESLPISF